MSASLEVEVLAGAEPSAEAELEAFFEACPTSFAQQTPSWRDVMSPSGKVTDTVANPACR